MANQRDLDELGAAARHEIEALQRRLEAEITRLQEARRAALKVADERSKENARLRAALQSIRRLGGDNDLPDAWAIVDRTLAS